MGEEHRPGACLRAGARAMAAQFPLHLRATEVQHPPRQRHIEVQNLRRRFGNDNTH